MNFIGKRQPLTALGLGAALDHMEMQSSEAATIWAR